ncbi:MAG TPA: hypothetical protein VK909_20040 [Anaerolineales bacterium]|nr:hypothetical protein [Anaerolineales bacterium]
MSKTLKRYTQLPFLIHMLETRELALLSPSSWDDRNDAYYLERYQQYNKFASVFVLCLTEASTTYHHWKIFAESTSGVCIEFVRERFISWATKKGIRHGSVQYLSLRKAKAEPPTAETLPFRKRHAFEDEKEFRLLYVSHDPGGPIKTFPLDLQTIECIKLNPWLPEDVFKSVRESIHRIPGCESLSVEQSHLLTNQEWANMGDGDAQG